MGTATATARKGAPVVRPIRNGQEFESAVTELDFLIDQNPQEGTLAHDRMELLAILIGAYEEEHLPSFEPASAQEVVRFMAEQKGVTQAALAEILGGRSRLSEFFNGTRSLSKTQIIRLKESLGIPADLLLGC